MKPKTLATVLFAAVGVYAIVEAVILLQILITNVVNPIAAGPNDGVAAESIPVVISFGLICPIALLAIGLWLLLRPPLRGLTGRIPGGEAASDSFSCRTLLRASMMIIGIGLLCPATVKLIYLGFAWMLARDNSFAGMMMHYTFWTNIAEVGVGVALGIYLLSGAPHLVRWMVRRLDDSGETDDDDTPQSRPRITT